MPIYEYKCQKCDHKIESLGKFGDSAIVQLVVPDCPTEGICESKFRRVLSPPRLNKRQGQPNVTQKEGGYVTEHWDGRQDVTVTPDPVVMRPRIGEVGG